MPTDKPVILVANHQNAMLDPVLICLFSSKQLHWLTRADLFRKPAVNKLLRRLNMMPVYRDRDRVSDITQRNNATFNECFDRLNHQAVICIFPEGTHRGKKQLVPLKKGLARLVLGALNAGVKDLMIQPVGLDYENYYEYRKRLVINFGNPLLASELLMEDGGNISRQLSAITEEITVRLKQLMIHIDSDDVYQEIMSLQPLSEKIAISSSAGAEFDAFKFWSDRLDKDTETHFWLNHQVGDYRKLMHELHINESKFRERFSRMNVLALFAGIPFVLIALLVFYPVYFLTEKIVESVVRDPLFKNSIRLVVWTFLTPIWILLVVFLVKIITCNSIFAWAFAAGAVVSGLITLQWINVWSLFKHHRKCLTLEVENHAQFGKWKEIRKDIVNKLKSIKSNG